MTPVGWFAHVVPTEARRVWTAIRPQARSLVLILSASLVLTACTESRTAVPPAQETANPTVTATATALLAVTPSPTDTPAASGQSGVVKGVLMLEPERGDCGRYITVRGTGFQPGATVGLGLVVGAEFLSGGGEITIPADGGFVQNMPIFRYPECRDGEQFRIIARDLRTPRIGEELALVRMPDPETVYTVANPSDPVITLSAVNGPCDATIEVIGTGLASHTASVRVGLMRLNTDSPQAVLGTATVGRDGTFRLPVTLGLDGCASAQGYGSSSGIHPFSLAVYDATEAPLLWIGRVQYTPTTNEPSPTGSRHRNPAWAEPTCCL